LGLGCFEKRKHTEDENDEQNQIAHLTIILIIMAGKIVSLDAYYLV